MRKADERCGAVFRRLVVRYRKRNLAWIFAINADNGLWNLWIFHLLQRLKMTRVCLLCWVILSCHTERSEVSINLKCKFAPLRRGFFCCGLRLASRSVALCESSKWQEPSCMIKFKALFEICLNFLVVKHYFAVDCRSFSKTARNNG